MLPPPSPSPFSFSSELRRGVVEILCGGDSRIIRILFFGGCSQGCRSTTHPHFIRKVRYKESTGEKEKNIKRVQGKRRKTSREYKGKGEKYQESTREKEKTAREYKPGTILLEMKREQSKLIYHSSFFVELPR